MGMMRLSKAWLMFGATVTTVALLAACGAPPKDSSQSFASARSGSGSVTGSGSVSGPSSAPDSTSRSPANPAPTSNSASDSPSTPPDLLTATGQPTVPADVPTVAANPTVIGERPPVPPVMEHTNAGAVAFARFFLQTLDWGTATVDSRYVRRYFAATCLQCVVLSRNLDTDRSVGSTYLGGRITILSASNVASDGRFKSDASVRLNLKLGALAIKDASGVFVTGVRGFSLLYEQVWLVWSGAEWTVVDAVVSYY
jgi:hypothetical protein